MYTMPYWYRKTILYSTLLKATSHCELWSHSHWNLVDFAISSSFKYCLRHVRNKFFFTLIVRWKNAAECVDLNNKTLITEQEAYIFVEEQQNLSSKWANLGVSKLTNSRLTGAVLHNYRLLNHQEPPCLEKISLTEIYVPPAGLNY